jgi:non-lysosomal glucosylceramidase
LSIAAEGLKEYKNWLAAVDDWVLPIAENKNCPDWLKAGALNELYYTTFGGSFWENGCVNREKKIGNRKGQHISGTMECTDYAFFETFDVRHHIARTTRDLWPKNEKDILLAYADAIMSTPLGSCPHDLGSPHNDPFNDPDAYVKGYHAGLFRGMGTTPWSEFSPKFIQQVFMYWKQYGDDAFLSECWPAIKRSYNYQVATDMNDDGITEMNSSEYVKNKLLNAVLWITSLEALKEMAAYRKDAALLSQADAQLAKARPNSEQQFWNASLGYYQYNETNHALMADALVGQRCGDVFGLPPALNEKRMTAHLEQCFDRLVKPLRDDDGDGVGDLGAANIGSPQGEPTVKTSEYDHDYEVWTGVSYNLAAVMYHWGNYSGNETLKKNALLTGKGVYRQCWLNEQNGFWFASPEAYWYAHMPKARALMYQRARGIWELMKEVADSNHY